jgi:hypothetical protein
MFPPVLAKVEIGASKIAIARLLSTFLCQHRDIDTRESGSISLALECNLQLEVELEG